MSSCDRARAGDGAAVALGQEHTGRGCRGDDARRATGDAEVRAYVSACTCARLFVCDRLTPPQLHAAVSTHARHDAVLAVGAAAAADDGGTCACERAILHGVLCVSPLVIPCMRSLSPLSPPPLPRLYAGLSTTARRRSSRLRPVRRRRLLLSEWGDVCDEHCDCANAHSHPFSHTHTRARRGVQGPPEIAKSEIKFDPTADLIGQGSFGKVYRAGV
jgi:hypothetical protein